MEDLIKNKMFWAVVIVFCMNVGVFLVGKVVVDKAADKVIERLEKEYSPSPYGPGFDPDKVNALRRLYYEIRQEKNRNGDFVEQGFVTPGFRATVRNADDWRSNWESDRGVSP